MWALILNANIFLTSTLFTVKEKGKADEMVKVDDPVAFLF